MVERAEQSLLERQVIGRLVHCPARLYELHLEPEDFLDPWCRKAYRAILAAVTAHDPEKVDALVIEEASGGKVDANDLVTASADPCIDVLLEHHAERIRCTALAQRVRRKADDLSHSALEGDELLAEAMTAFNGLGQVRDDRSISLKDSQQEMWAEFLATRRGDKPGLKTGFKDMDDLGCLERGGVCVIAGRPSMGKSALTLWLSRHLAANGERVLVFSTEMAHRKWSRRMVASEARVNSRALATGSANVTDMAAIKDAIISTAPLPIWIDDQSDRLKSIVVAIRQHRQRNQITVAIVDHLQECIQGKEANRELTELLGALRSVSRESPKTTLILVSQLNREVEKRPDKMPLMSDLRESGRIEEVADSVLLCYRPHYYTPDKSDASEFLIKVAKNRDGNTGRLELVWDPKNGCIRGVKSGHLDVENS